MRFQCVETSPAGIQCAKEHNHLGDHDEPVESVDDPDRRWPQTIDRCAKLTPAGYTCMRDENHQGEHRQLGWMADGKPRVDPVEGELAKAFDPRSRSTNRPSSRATPPPGVTRPKSPLSREQLQHALRDEQSRCKRRGHEFEPGDAMAVFDAWLDGNVPLRDPAKVEKRPPLHGLIDEERAALEEAYCFYAGLNLQYHPRVDQQRHVAIIRSLGRLLNPVKAER